MSVELQTELPPTELVDEEVWIVPPPSSGAIARRLTEARPGPRGVLVTISGVADAAAAHELTGRWLLARGEESPHSLKDERSVIGFEVTDSSHGFIGRVKDVIVTGANDVLVVEEGPFGQVLVPVIEQVILRVNNESHAIDVSLLNGLIDEAFE
ncbi:MAG: hypothetical protein JXA36_05320 [Coriobacteriia bacterium]|nr:hypothetical protein [Coriobacteriia bacterium]